MTRLNSAQKATEQVKVIEAKVSSILNYFEQGLTYDRNWLRDQLTDVVKDALDIERGAVKIRVKKNRKGAVVPTDSTGFYCKFHKEFHFDGHVVCQRDSINKPGYIYEDELPENWWAGEE